MRTQRQNAGWKKKAGIGFIKAEEGLATLEFGLSIGLVLLILLGGIEVSRYVLIYQKLQNAVNMESNMVTSINPSTTTMTTTEMNSILAGAAIMMEPYSFTAANSALIFTDIYAPITSDITKPGSPIVKWRYCNSSSLGQESKLGALNGAANLTILPNNFAMNQGDEIVAAEIYYSYAPIIKDSITQKIIPTRVIYDIAISVPHYSTLSSLIGSNCN